MTPIAPGWSRNVPALDNGQLLWSMYATISTLKVKKKISELILFICI